MQRYSRLWWASILLSSVVTGGGSFALMALLTDWPLLTIIKAGIVMVLVGDITLALLMEAISPTRIKVGPGERLRSTDHPADVGTVLEDFSAGRGRVSIRGETWRARQTPDGRERLGAGDRVRVVEREGLMLVVEIIPPG